MKVLLTGGSGLAGMAITNDLTAHGHTVLRVDRVAPLDAPHTRGQVGASTFKFVDRNSWTELTWGRSFRQ